MNGCVDRVDRVGDRTIRYGFRIVVPLEIAEHRWRTALLEAIDFDRGIEIRAVLRTALFLGIQGLMRNAADHYRGNDAHDRDHHQQFEQ